MRKAADLRKGTRGIPSVPSTPKRTGPPEAHSTFTAMICPLGMCRIFSTTPYAPRPSSEMGSRSSAFTSKFWGTKAISGPWVFVLCPRSAALLAQPPPVHPLPGCAQPWEAAGRISHHHSDPRALRGWISWTWGTKSLSHRG